MRFSFRALVLVLLLFVGGSGTAHAWTWGDLAAGIDSSTLVVPFIVVALTLASIALHKASGYLDQKKEASQVSGYLNTVSSVADGIAETLLTHPPAPADVVTAVRNAAVAQGVLYLKRTHVGTILDVGISDDVLATRLSNTVAGKLLGTVSGEPLGSLGQASAPTPDAVALPPALVPAGALNAAPLLPPQAG